MSNDNNNDGDKPAIPKTYDFGLPIAELFEKELSGGGVVRSIYSYSSCTSDIELWNIVFENRGEETRYPVYKIDTNEFRRGFPHPDAGLLTLYNGDRLENAPPGSTVFYDLDEAFADRLTAYGVLATVSCDPSLPARTSCGGLIGLRLLITFQDRTPGMALTRAHIRWLRENGVEPLLLDRKPLGLSTQQGLSDYLSLHPAITAAELNALPSIPATDRAIDELVGRIEFIDPSWPPPKSYIDLPEDEPPYPVHALPEEIYNAAAEGQQYGQMPFPIVMASVLSTLSVAAQGMADIARDSRLRGPLSMMLLTIAKSSERKSTADHPYYSELKRWEAEYCRRMKVQIDLLEADHRVWRELCKDLETKILKATGKDDGMEAKKLRQQLEELLKREPQRLIDPQLLGEDITQEKLAKALGKGRPSLILSSNEGGTIVGGRSMSSESVLSYITLIDKMWDGQGYRQDRKTAESVTIHCARLTLNIMLQPEVFRDMLNRRGDMIRGSGFLARNLLTWPVSTMGFRLYKEPPANEDHIKKFLSRIVEMLDNDLPTDESGKLTLKALRLSGSASTLWRNYHDEIERQMHPLLGKYRKYTDFAGKSAEQAVRIAGCFHLYTGASVNDPVSDVHMRGGIDLARYYLDRTVAVLGVAVQSPEIMAAQKLEAWLIERAQGGLETTEGEILHGGPLRNRAERDKALDLLYSHSRARCVTIGRKEIIEVNPTLLQKPAVASGVEVPASTKPPDSLPVRQALHTDPEPELDEVSKPVEGGEADWEEGES